MDPQALWAAFRGLPTWVQVIAWLVAWPAQAALAIWKASPRSPAARGAAAAVLLVGGLLWIAALSGGDSGDEPAVAIEDQARGSADDEAAEPTKPATPSASPSPAKTAAAVVPPPVAPSPSVAPPSPSPSPAAVAAAGWTVTNVVDGDTVDVRAADGTEERVRLIGMDTPERGECGFAEASDALAAMVLGETVDLVAGARDDRDRYDRILRYVDVDGLDAGLALIEQGYAIARYDSRDGYGKHPREDAYVAADAEGASNGCTAAAPAPKPSPIQTQQPATASNPWGTASCDPAYDPWCPPTSEVGDLDCRDITAKCPSGFSVDWSHGDPHRLDGDKDGVACEA